MKNYFLIYIIIFLAVFQLAQQAQKVTDLSKFDEKLKLISSSPFSKQRVKYIYFFLNRKKVKNVQYFSNMLEDFLLTLNIRGTVYVIEDQVLIAIVNMDAEVNTEFLMKHFDGAFRDVKVRYPA